MSEVEAAEAQELQEPTQTGLEAKLAAALAYLLFFASGVAFLVLEPRQRYVRFHAYQSVATFGALFVISVAANFIPLVGWIIGALVAPVSVVLWILLMVKALQGERFKLPWVGDWAEEQVG